MARDDCVRRWIIRYFPWTIGMLILIGMEAFLLREGLRTDSPNWAADIRWWWVVPAVIFFVAFASGLVKKRRSALRIVLYALCVLVVMTIFVWDRWNVLVEKGEWLKRGQPAKWTRQHSYLPNTQDRSVQKLGQAGRTTWRESVNSPPARPMRPSVYLYSGRRAVEEHGPGWKRESPDWLG